MASKQKSSNDSEKFTKITAFKNVLLSSQTTEGEKLLNRE